MYSTSETVGLELKYIAKDLTKAGLSSAKAALSSFSGFAMGVASKVKAAFSKVWATITSPVALITGGMGLAGAFYGIKSYLTGAVRTAGEWEGYLAKLSVALKSASKAKEAFEWSKQFAATTPFEMGEVVDATTRLEMYGLTAKKWLPLVGDMAGAMGRHITDAVEAIADAISGGGLERLKEFGITSTALLKAGAKPAAGGYSVSYQGQEAIDRLKSALISIMSSRYGGGMTKLLATWTGKTSNLADAWTQIKGRIGEGMMPVLKRIVDKTTEWINLLLKAGVGEKIGKKLGEWIEWAWGKFQTGVKWAIDNWPKLSKKVSSWATIIWLWVKSIGQKIADWAGYGDNFRMTLGKTQANLSDIAKAARDFSDAMGGIQATGLRFHMVLIGWKIEAMEVYKYFSKAGALFNRWLQWQEKMPGTFGWIANQTMSTTNFERATYWESEAKNTERRVNDAFSQYWQAEADLQKMRENAKAAVAARASQGPAAITPITATGGATEQPAQPAYATRAYRSPEAQRLNEAFWRQEQERMSVETLKARQRREEELAQRFPQKVSVANVDAIGSAMQRGQQRVNAAPAY